MNRIVAAEWLDVLTPDDQRAINSRRDLRRLNSCMGHRRQMIGGLQRLFGDGQPRRLVELGAGDGTFMLGLAKKLCRQWPAVTVTLLDRQPTIPDSVCRGIEQCGWKTEIVTADVFDWLATGREADCVVANLFLHHFDSAALSRLLAMIADSANAMVACEPRRSKTAFFAGRLLWLLGCNSVTRHDAPVSVRAGFCEQELSSLWPREGWKTQERAAGLFTHLFTARKL
jgi:hypothetical protein